MVLKQHGKLNQDKAGVFLVDKVVLGYQQFKYIKNETGLKCKVICSDNSNLLHDIDSILKRKYDIFILTAGTFWNMIQDKNSSHGIFCMIHTIIFDEIHHASGEHVYAQIIQKLFSHNEIKKAQRPAIVGLSASIGNSIEKMDQLCRFVGCNVFYPVLFRNQLKNVIVDTDTKLESCSSTISQENYGILHELQRKYHFLIVWLLEAMKQMNLYNQLSNIPSVSKLKILYDIEHAQSFKLFQDIRNILQKESKNFGQQQQQETIDFIEIICDYGQSLILSYKSFVLFGGIIVMQDMLGTLTNVRQQLSLPKFGKIQIKYNINHKSIITNVGILVGYIQEKMRVVENSQRFIKLKQIICQCITFLDARGISLRGIIFVQTRKDVKLLENTLRSDKDIQQYKLNPTRIVGQGFVDGMEWETQQRPTLDKFEKGNIKLLVSTSVLEEGLDVQQCNVVIRYNLPNTLISHIQSRGRIRSKLDERYNQYYILCNETEKKRVQSIVDFESTMVNHLTYVMKQQYEANPRVLNDLERKTRAIVAEKREMEQLRRSSKIDNQPGDSGKNRSISLIFDLYDFTLIGDRNEEDREFLVTDELNANDKKQFMEDKMIELFNNCTIIENIECECQWLILPNEKMVANHSKYLLSFDVLVRRSTGMLGITPELDNRCFGTMFDVVEEHEQFWLQWKQNQASLDQLQGRQKIDSKGLHIGYLQQYNELVSCEYIYSKPLQFKVTNHYLVIGIDCKAPRTFVLKFPLSFIVKQRIFISKNRTMKSNRHHNMGDEKEAELDAETDGKNKYNGKYIMYFTSETSPLCFETNENDPNIQDENEIITNRIVFMNDIIGKYFTYGIEIENPDIVLGLVRKGMKPIFCTTTIIDSRNNENTNSQWISSKLAQFYPNKLMISQHISLHLDYYWQCIEREYNYASYYIANSLKQFFQESKWFDKNWNELPTPLKMYTLLTQLKSMDVDCNIESIFESWKIDCADGNGKNTPQQPPKQKRLPYNDEVDNNLKQYTCVRFVTITPSRIIYQLPQYMLLNRVLRHFGTKDFVLIRFRDETLTTINGQNDQLLRDRVKVVLNNGIGLNIHGKLDRYFFVAASNSQLRQHHCWMMKVDNLNQVNQKIQDIYDWMGDFSKLTNNGGKYLKRLAQSFSATFATNVKIPQIAMQDSNLIKDIFTTREQECDPIIKTKKEKLCFSDGIGRIDPSLLKYIIDNSSAYLRTSGACLSAIQIRVAGMKGVLCKYPTTNKNNNSNYNYKYNYNLIHNSGDVAKLVQFRQSMKKFESKRNEIEIVSIANPVPACLNRQIITLLSEYKLDRMYIIQLLQIELDRLQKMLMVNEEGIKVLKQTLCNKSGIFSDSLMIQQLLLKDSYCQQLDVINEPFWHDLLKTIYKYKIRKLKEKAAIPVSKGRLLMGVLDESQTLEYGQVFIKIFDKNMIHDTTIIRRRGYHNRNDDCKDENELNKNGINIVGKVIVYKSPCVNPSDVRVLTAVQESYVPPDIGNLCNVIVFPAKGKRPHTHECSGSDLDGDRYSIIWDPNIVNNIAQVYSKEHINSEIDDANVNDIHDLFEANETSKSNYSSYNSDNTVAIATRTLDLRHNLSDKYIEFMKNSLLGQIANAWQARADWCIHSEYEKLKRTQTISEDKLCQILSVLHSFEVDSLTSNKHINRTSFEKLIEDLRYPDYLEHTITHKKLKDDQIYTSESICGAIYHRLKLLECNTDEIFHLQCFNEIEMKQSVLYPILNKNGGTLKFNAAVLKKTREIFAEYQTDIAGLLNIFGIKSEHEIICQSLLTSHPYLMSKKEHLSSSVFQLFQSIQLQYRQRFFNEFGGEKQFFQTKWNANNNNNMNWMEKSICWYYVCYKHSIDKNKVDVTSDTKPSCMSFAWIIGDLLIDIESNYKHKVAATVDERSINTFYSKIWNSCHKLCNESLEDQITLSLEFNQHKNGIIAQISDVLKNYGRICIFGSYKTGLFHETSDIDLYLLVNGKSLSEKQITRDIMPLLKDNVESINDIELKTKPVHYITMKFAFMDKSIDISFRDAGFRRCNAVATYLHQFPKLYFILLTLSIWARNGQIIGPEGLSRKKFPSIAFQMLVIHYLTKIEKQDEFVIDVSGIYDQVSKRNETMDICSIWNKIALFTQKEKIQCAGLIINFITYLACLEAPFELPILSLIQSLANETFGMLDNNDKNDLNLINQITAQSQQTLHSFSLICDFPLRFNMFNDTGREQTKQVRFKLSRKISTRINNCERLNSYKFSIKTGANVEFTRIGDGVDGIFCTIIGNSYQISNARKMINTSFAQLSLMPPPFKVQFTKDSTLIFVKNVFNFDQDCIGLTKYHGHSHIHHQTRDIYQTVLLYDNIGTGSIKTNRNWNIQMFELFIHRLHQQYTRFVQYPHKSTYDIQLVARFGTFYVMNVTSASSNTNAMNAKYSINQIVSSLTKGRKMTRPWDLNNLRRLRIQKYKQQMKQSIKDAKALISEQNEMKLQSQNNQSIDDIIGYALYGGEYHKMKKKEKKQAKKHQKQKEKQNRAKDISASFWNEISENFRNKIVHQQLLEKMGYKRIDDNKEDSVEYTIVMQNNNEEYHFKVNQEMKYNQDARIKHRVVRWLANTILWRDKGLRKSNPTHAQMPMDMRIYFNAEQKLDLKHYFYTILMTNVEEPLLINIEKQSHAENKNGNKIVEIDLNRKIQNEDKQKLLNQVYLIRKKEKIEYYRRKDDIKIVLYQVTLYLNEKTQLKLYSNHYELDIYANSVCDCSVTPSAFVTAAKNLWNAVWELTRCY